MNLIDKLIENVSPRTALKRESDRWKLEKIR